MCLRCFLGLSRVYWYSYFFQFRFLLCLNELCIIAAGVHTSVPPHTTIAHTSPSPFTVSRTLMCVRRTHERVHWQVVRSNPVGCETLVQAPLPPFGPCPYPKRPLAVFPSLVLLPPSSSLQFPHCILLTFYTLPFYILTFSRIVLASFISVFRATSDS